MMLHVAVSSLLLGLVGSTHCASMCGGLVVATHVPADARRRLASWQARGSVVMAQNAGRVLSYALAGAAAGGLGQVVGTVHAAAARTVLQWLAALVLVLVGTRLAGLLPAALDPERLGAPLWRRLGPRARALLPLSTPRHAFAFGLLWGFLPCGLVYSALAVASVSGSIATGFVGMLAFGLGTLPMLLGLGTLAGSISRVFRRGAYRRAAGALVAGFGVVQVVWLVQASQAPHSCCPKPHLSLSSAEASASFRFV